MSLEVIVYLATMGVAYLLGKVAKKCSFINNHLIPLQNILVGLIVAVVEYLITKDFNFAITTSGLLAGGIYDVGHNLKKMIENGKNN